MQIEKKSGMLAIQPLMLAERDREFLKQVRRRPADLWRLLIFFIFS